MIANRRLFRRAILFSVAVALTCQDLSLAQPAPRPAVKPLAQAAPAFPLRFGVAWYPEQWPEERWEADLALMQAAHINVVRVGEFAWSALEPREGQFDFAWLDRAIEAAGRHHIAVVLGTPTAAPPAWLTTKYPETLRVGEDGQRAEHGERQQFNFADVRYRQLARRMAEQMAIRYGANPNVIGWQVDNEIGVPSYDAETKAQFHRWLAAKYGPINDLNARWTTRYWSQFYDSYDQIPMHSRDENPGLLLDLHRFFSDTWASYIENQAEAIRGHADRRQFITTNTLGWRADFDPYVLHRRLDLSAWDEYMPTSKYAWLDQGAKHDLVRGYKRATFWVMETQPAFVNWGGINAALRPGQTREVAWQAIGHGADAVLYWQWRSALNGQEQYHGTLVGPDGEPEPVYAEVARTGAEFARTSTALVGTSPHAQVAVLNDADSRWALEAQRHTTAYDPVAATEAFYRPLALKAQAVDIISPDTPLAGYRLVVAPALNVLTQAEAQRLAEYVRNGGHLVLGPRSGMKDGDDALNPQRQPGPLAALLGGRVEQFYALDRPIAVAGEIGAGAAGVWAEALSAKRPDTLAPLHYAKTGGWLDGQAAMLTHRVGKGSITYIGALLEPALMTQVMDKMLVEAAIRPILAGVPEPVEVMERTGQGRRVLVLINHGDLPAEVPLPIPLTDVLTRTPVKAAHIPAHDVLVLEAAMGK